MARQALVLGGGTGLGLACAVALAADGARVALSGRRQSVLEEALQALPAAAGHLALPGDATQEADVERVAATAAAAMSGLDCVVVSAGRSAIGTAETTQTAEFLDMLRDNLAPLFLAAKFAPRHFPPSGGAIVAITSVFGVVGYPDRVAYCAAKAGAIGLVRALALDLAPRRIRVNAVSPSLVLTPLAREVMAREADPAATLARRTAQHPIGRLGEPGDVGAMVAHLCSDCGAWVTGQNFVLDGGLTAA